MNPPEEANSPPAHDKPVGERLGWQVVESRRIFESPVNRVRVDQLQIPSRGRIQYSYLERGESVIIVPVTADGRIALIRQYRYPVDAICYELPAGCCRDTSDAGLEEVARKELREEIGGTAGGLEYLTWYYSSSSLSDEVCHVFLALDVRLDQETDREPGEHIETHLLPVHEALALVRRGEMRTGTCALAILHCESATAGRRLVVGRLFLTAGAILRHGGPRFVLMLIQSLPRCAGAVVRLARYPSQNTLMNPKAKDLTKKPPPAPPSASADT